MITLRCKLKPEDYIQAQYLHMRSISRLRGKVRFQRLF
jgi:hypothetical protein